MSRKLAALLLGVIWLGLTSPPLANGKNGTNYFLIITHEPGDVDDNGNDIWKAGDRYDDTLKVEGQKPTWQVVDDARKDILKERKGVKVEILSQPDIPIEFSSGPLPAHLVTPDFKSKPIESTPFQSQGRIVATFGLQPVKLDFYTDGVLVAEEGSRTFTGKYTQEGETSLLFETAIYRYRTNVWKGELKIRRIELSNSKTIEFGTINRSTFSIDKKVQPITNDTTSPTRKAPRVEPKVELERKVELESDDLPGTVWVLSTGLEQGFPWPKFVFHADGVFETQDRDRSFKNATWSRKGNKVTVRFSSGFSKSYTLDGRKLIDDSDGIPYLKQGGRQEVGSDAAPEPPAPRKPRKRARASAPPAPAPPPAPSP